MSALRTLIGPGDQHEDGARIELVAHGVTLLPATLSSTATSDLEVLLCLSGAISVLLATSPELRAQFLDLLEVDGATPADRERVAGWFNATFGDLTLVQLAASGRRTADALHALGLGEDECPSS